MYTTINQADKDIFSRVSMCILNEYVTAFKTKFTPRKTNYSFLLTRPSDTIRLCIN